MQDGSDKKNPRRNWAIPASVALHLVIAAAFFLRLPDTTPVPEEPSSVQVELVEPLPEPLPEPPPQPEPPAREPPPPPAEPAVAEPQEPVRPPIETLPAIPIRPEPAEMASEDNPASLEEEPSSPPEEAADAPVSENNAEAQGQPQDTPEATPETEPAATADSGELPPPADVEEKNPEQALAAGTDQDAPPDVKPSAVAEKQDEKPKEDKRKEAKQLLSKTALGSPRLRQLLGDLPPRRRLVQMCSIEALAQIRKSRSGQSQPDGLVPYSEKGGLIAGNVLDATGGAFNIGNKWFGIDFHCEVDMETFTVTSFRFALGAPVPPDEVKRRGYPAQ